jgi:hypothetical protein
MDLSKPRGDLTVLESSIVRAVLGDELYPIPAASAPSASASPPPPVSPSVSPSVSGLALSGTCSRDGDEFQSRNNIPRVVAEGSLSSTSTARTADCSSRQGPDSIGNERSSSSSVTSSPTCNDAISILHGPVDITSVIACSIGTPIQPPSNIEHAINIDRRNSVPKTDRISGLKRGKYESCTYDEEREQIEAKRCLGLLTPAACFAFANSRKKRRRNADQEEYLEEDEERAEECGSYVKTRSNVEATPKSPLKVGDDLSCADSDIYRERRKSPVVANGVDMDDMAATMGFSNFKNKYKS